MRNPRRIAALITQALVWLKSPRADFQTIHDVADAYEARFRRAVMSAFEDGANIAEQHLLLMSHEHVSNVMDQVLSTIKKSLGEVLEDVIRNVFNAGGKAAVKRLKSRLRISAAKDDTGISKDLKFDVTNPRAIEWARKHAADLVINITDTTRDKIRELVEAAFEEQFTVDDLRKEIDDLVADPDRAETIARTEVISASNAGQKELWNQAVDEEILTGREKKEWIVTPDDKLCPICEPMDGVQVGLDEDFQLNTGDRVDTPPAHPRCRCAVGLAL